MVQVLSENWGNILVLVIVAFVTGLVLRNMVRRKKAGRSSCGCGCSNCPSNGVCHPKR